MRFPKLVVHPNENNVVEKKLIKRARNCLKERVTKYCFSQTQQLQCFLIFTV